jgi:hypothetical protein
MKEEKEKLYNKASKYHLHWTEEEDNIIKELWPSRNTTYEDLEKVLRLRSLEAIKSRIRTLKVTKDYGALIDREQLKKMREALEI